MTQASKILHIIVLLAVLPWQASAAFAAQAANQWQTHASIRSAAQTFLEAFAGDQHEGRIEVRLGKLDPRLKLKTCSQPLDAFLPPGGRNKGNSSVGVRCGDDDGWNIYVSARIDVFGPVLVTRQPLARGTRIQDADVEMVERNLSNLPYGYYTDSAPIAGMLAKRTISAATVITPQMIQAPRLVKRGDQVTVVAETGPLKIRTVGKAMSDGKSGDLIRIESENSKRIVDGIVISQGVVKVTL